MVEIKLSQGAKPGHGGVLPAAKVSRRSQQTRGVPMGEDCISPSQPLRLLHADRDDGVHRRDAPAVGRQAGGLQALHRPRVGVPGHLQGDAGDRHLPRLHRRRRQGGRHRRRPAGVQRPYRHADAAGPLLRAQRAGRLRPRASTSSSARPARSSPPSTSPACWRIGADWCNAARGFMFAVGCIQSQSLPHRPLPDRRRHPGPAAPARALRARQGRARLQLPHAPPCTSWPRLTAAAGFDHPSEFKPIHISRRISPSEVATFADMYPALSEGELVAGTGNPRWSQAVGPRQRAFVPRRGPLDAGICCGPGFLGPAMRDQEKTRGNAMTAPFDFAPLLAPGTPAPAAKFNGFPKYNFVGGHNDAKHVPVQALIDAGDRRAEARGHRRSRPTASTAARWATSRCASSCRPSSRATPASSAPPTRS